jgi:regulator of sigma E protease
MMSFASSWPGTVVVFLVVLTVLVFVHELGHYLVARRNGVRIEVFSIGFGPELFGWFDRAGTRWKLSAVPLGGYVKMYGDADASSMPSGAIKIMTEDEKAVSFHHKRLGQRIAVVAAGPIANFLFAVVLLAGLFMTVGQQFTLPEVGQVEPNSAAERGGLKPGDTILTIDGTSIESFADIQREVYSNPGVPMQLVVLRDGGQQTLTITPRMTEMTDRFGNTYRVGLLGIRRSGVDYIRRGPIEAVSRAGGEIWNLSVGTLKASWQMIIGQRSTDELGGPLRIAQMSGEVAQGGIAALLYFMAVLSVNLGLINLFPIPVLDGGHLLFYVAEAIRGKPLGQRAQEYGFRVGLALVLSLMVLVTWNDLSHLGIVAFFKGLIS